MDSLLQRLLEDVQGLAGDQVEKIVSKFREVITYTPTIGVCGKTGVGKSTLCNALFGADVAAVDDVEACTREPQRIHIRVHESHNIELIDMPGVGETEERDTEYAQLYKAVLPELDLVMWVLKADDRAMTIDRHFYDTVVRPATSVTPILFVVNQVDQISPSKEWDHVRHEPSSKQLQNIDRKRAFVKRTFSVPTSQTVVVSGEEKYGLAELVHRIVSILPNEKKMSIVREVVPGMVSDQTAAEAKRGVLQSIIDFVKETVATAVVVAVVYIVDRAVEFVLERYRDPKKREALDA